MPLLQDTPGGSHQRPPLSDTESTQYLRGCGPSANLANWFASVGDCVDRAVALTHTGMVLMSIATEFEGTDRGEQLKLDAGSTPKLLLLAGD